MAYDEDLADRIRELLATERVSPGRRCSADSASWSRATWPSPLAGRGVSWCESNPDESDQLARTTKAESMVMRGRPMAGWMRVASEHVGTKRQIREVGPHGVGVRAVAPRKGQEEVW